MTGLSYWTLDVTKQRNGNARERRQIPTLASLVYIMFGSLMQCMSLHISYIVSEFYILCIFLLDFDAATQRLYQKNTKQIKHNAEAYQREKEKMYVLYELLILLLKLYCV